MKYIKLYESYINEDNSTWRSALRKSLLIKYRPEDLLDILGIENYTINDDESVDVNGDVNIRDNLIGEKLPFWKFRVKKLPIKFGKVTGNFNCDDGYLETLEGCPNYVGGMFKCSNNKLINLKGSPSDVGGHYYCNNNNLKSLDGSMSLEIGGSFHCYNNPNLKSLDSISNIEGNIYFDEGVDISEFVGYCKGFKNYINSRWVDIKLNESITEEYSELEKLKQNLYLYDIHNYTINEDLTVDVNDSLNLSSKLYYLDSSGFRRPIGHLPIRFKNVYGNFNISGNELKSLEGCPEYIDGSFYCHINNLKNLIGGPKEVTWNYYCRNSGIKSLEGMALEIGKNFNCVDCDIKELKSISNIEENIICDSHIDITKFKGYCKKIIQ